MKLAKQHIDVGYQTNRIEAMLRFWQQEVGLVFEELLAINATDKQHRHALNGSVFKLNEVAAELTTSDPTGYTGLLIAEESVEEPISLYDPDNNRVTLVPPDFADLTRVGIEIEVSSLEKSGSFYANVLGAQRHSDTCFQLGTTLIYLSENTTLAPTKGLHGSGFRYLTIQVLDVDVEHRKAVKAGANATVEPFNMGKTARISFITDPDGNWIELSQRASLTGPLPNDME